jgi:hypothetical protein
VNNFEDLYNVLVSEAPLKDYIKAAKITSGADKAGFKTGLLGKAVTGLGNLASRAVGTVGQGLGVQGKSVPGTNALQAGITKTTGTIGSGLQTVAGVKRMAQQIQKYRDNPASVSTNAPQQSYMTVPSTQLPIANYKQNDVVVFKNANGKNMRGRYGGSAQDAQNSNVAIILDPEYV